MTKKLWKTLISDSENKFWNELFSEPEDKQITCSSSVSSSGDGITWTTTTTDHTEIWPRPSTTGGHTHITTNPGQPANGGWTAGSWQILYPPQLQEGQEAWPKVDDALGVLFIDGDEIKLKMNNGKEITVGRLDDSDDFIPIEVVIAKKRLIEEANE